MNKYIYAVADTDGIDYHTVVAKDFHAAEDKIIDRFYNELEWDCPDDWRDFKTYALKMYNLIIGDPKDIETF